MKILYYDCFSGISGDMNIGAMLDLGVPLDYLAGELDKLGLGNHYTLQAEKRIKMGIEGTKFDVLLLDPDHTHGHEEHIHRGFSDIKRIIESSLLSVTIKHRAIEIFRHLAVSEAKVHGTTVDEVHFHEVGAVDAIVDIVGAAICLEYLGVDEVYSRTPETGHGFVKCAHGLMPVPAPATAELLTGIPFTQRLKGEATTPTGAAILKTVVKSFSRPDELVIERIGYGLGTKDFEQPNVLRVYLGELNPQAEKLTADVQYLLESNIDDMNPEFLGALEAKLLAAGALDVYRVPIYMKKGRLGIKLSILYDTKAEPEMLRLIFTETTTIGVRRFSVDKLMLNRTMHAVSTPYGEVTVKRAYYGGKCVNSKPEYEDLLRIAEANGVSVKDIFNKILPYLEV